MIIHPTLRLIATCAVVLMTSLSSGQDNYVADIRFYVDGPGFEKFRSAGVESEDDLEQAIQNLVDEMNTKYYSSLAKNGVNLLLRLEKVIYKDVVVEGEDGVIHSANIWNGFEDFLVNNDQYESSFDATMLLTGLDMYYGDNYGVYGMAHIATICQDLYRSGTSEITGELNHDALAVAHELGHIFGAEHDTEKNCPNGDYTDGNVMAAVNYFDDPDRFDFSECSANYFIKTFDKLKDNCMLDGSSPTSRPQTTTPPRIQPTTTRPPRTQPPTTRPTTTQDPDTSGYETPDEACQRLASKDHSFYRPYYAVAGYGNTFCRLLRCISHTWKTVSRYDTPDGIPCGQDKRCSSGRCVDADDTPFDESCPWGDQDFRDMKLRTCSQRSCGKRNWQNNYCCTYCSTVKSYRYVKN